MQLSSNQKSAIEKKIAAMTYDDNKSNPGTVALIVAKPGRIRDSIGTVIKAIAGIETVCLAEDRKSALSLIKSGRPSLVLIDVGLPNDHIETLLSYLTQKRLQIACVLLVDTIRQKWVGEALGADKVLIKGFTALELSDAIATLLSVKSKKSVGDNS